MSVRLVVFDLDETLVHATQELLNHAHGFEVPPYFVYVRPFATELIHFCAQRFDIAVWSSSSEKYVEAVTANLFGASYPTTFSWAVNRCVQKVDPRTNGYVYIKDLRKAQKHGYTVDEILMIDDSPEKLQRQPRRHLHIAPYTGDPGDRELLSVIDKLGELCA
jgi:RNA polymerase II subunit A small phosphatase-like protein